MSTSSSCNRCGSTEIIPRVRVVDRGDSNTRQDLEIEVHRKPNAIFFKRAERSQVFAQMCAACGHLEFFADMPRKLYTAYIQADPTSSVSAIEELERTREALADSQIQLHDLQEKLTFVEQLLANKESPKSLPKGE